MADFTTWSRSNLERLATDLVADNQRLRDENRTVLDAWRAEVCHNASTELNKEEGSCEK